MSRPLLYILIGTVFLGGTGGAVYVWRKHAIERQQVIALNQIQEDLENGDFNSARSALNGIADQKERESKEQAVRRTELERGVEIRDIGMIRKALSDDHPEWLPAELREKAALQIAREAIQLRNWDEYENLRKMWEKDTQMANQWFLLHVNKTLAENERQKAAELLEQTQLNGKEEAMRLARLALLKADQPWKAMEYIDQGLKADPRNAELLSFRAQIEETAGRRADARLDYVAAVLSDKKNPLYRDGLATFYIRGGDFSAAAETWRETAEETSLGVYAFKAWFWSRLAGIPLSQALPEIRQPSWKKVAAALSSIPENNFTTPELEAGLLEADASKRTEVAWLHILQQIKDGKLQDAQNTLTAGFPAEADRMRPQLRERILACLLARNGGNPKEAFAGKAPASIADTEHPFLKQFSKWATNQTPDEESAAFTTFLAKPDALIGSLLTSGWPGAALILGEDGAFSPTTPTPDWLEYGYAKSLQSRRGKEAARTWLEARNNRCTSSDLLLGELQIATGAVDSGLVLLQKVAGTQTEQAGRAAWSLAMIALEKGDSAGARKLVTDHADLAGGIQGKEILARAALAEGNRAETAKIYQELGTDSVDAMIFLSKEAFAAGNYSDARKWTTELAKRFPEVPKFRENLLKIAEMENQK